MYDRAMNRFGLSVVFLFVFSVHDRVEFLFQGAVWAKWLMRGTLARSNVCSWVRNCVLGCVYTPELSYRHSCNNSWLGFRDPASG